MSKTVDVIEGDVVVSEVFSLGMVDWCLYQCCSQTAFICLLGCISLLVDLVKFRIDQIRLQFRFHGVEGDVQVVIEIMS